MTDLELAVAAKSLQLCLTLYPFKSRMDKYKNYLCGVYIWRKKHEYIERTYIHLHIYI